MCRKMKLLSTSVVSFPKSQGKAQLWYTDQEKEAVDRMAADGGLRRLFEKPMLENPTLLEALSAWNHRAHPNRPIDTASFTEIFGELHFQEKPPPDHRAVLPHPAPAEAPPRPPPLTASWLDAAAEADKSKDDSSLDALLRPRPASSGVKRSSSFCVKKSSASSLLLCTEGLGSESAVDADDMLKDGDAAAAVSKETGAERAASEVGAAEEVKEKEKRSPPSFPPPIRSIGRGGKPCVCFRSFRADGRFVLVEVVIPGTELLQADREGGRLRLQFAAAAAAGVGVGEDMNNF
jgi:hypothetical protein